MYQNRQKLYLSFHTLAYYVLSFMLTALAVITCPFWMPIYFFYTSIHKSYVILKTLMKLPPKLLKLKKQVKQPGYAILKGNGKYLKGTDDDFLIYQLYDYTVRRFLTVRNLDTEMKVVEMEIQNNLGLQYLKKNCLIKDVKGITSNLKSKALSKQKMIKQNEQISIEISNYQIESFSNNYDCMICFSLREKLSSKIDILKILTYIKHHLSKQGYVVLGQYLQEGQVKVLKQLFQVYGLKIESIQDITKNVILSQKKLKKKKQQTMYQEFLLDEIHNKVLQIAGITQKQNNLKYYAFILQRSD